MLEYLQARFQKVADVKSNWFDLIYLPISLLLLMLRCQAVSPFVRILHDDLTISPLLPDDITHRITLTKQDVAI